MLYTVRLRVPLSWLGSVVSNKKASVFVQLLIIAAMPATKEPRTLFLHSVYHLLVADKRWSSPLLTGKAIRRAAYLRVYDY